MKPLEQKPCKLGWRESKQDPWTWLNHTFRDFDQADLYGRLLTQTFGDETLVVPCGSPSTEKE